MPAPAVEHALQAGTVAARARPKNAPAGFALGLLGGHAGRLGGSGVALHARPDRVHGVVFVVFGDGRHGTHRRIEKLDDIGEGIAKKSRDAQGHVDPGPVLDRHRQHLDVDHPAAAVGPLRPHAEQGESLADVFTAGAHGAGAPDRQAHRSGESAVVLKVALDHLLGGLGAHRIGGGRGHGAGVDRIEVAAGGQHVGPAARRCAARPRRHEAPSQAAQQLRGLVRAAGV